MGIAYCPKLVIPLDFNTMATVLFTIDLTALHSYDYEKQVIERLDRSISANRTFRFRNEFADQWYDLNNPDLTNAPMVRPLRNPPRRLPPPTLTTSKFNTSCSTSSAKTVSPSKSPFVTCNLPSEMASAPSAAALKPLMESSAPRRGNGTSWLPAIGQGSLRGMGARL